jgi:hypothetical protein
MVIGGRGGSASEPIRRLSEAIYDLCPNLALKRLDNTAFIEHNTRKVAGIEMVKHLVVSDIDPWQNILLFSTSMDDKPHASTFSNRLRYHRQRGQYQYILA